MPEPTQFIAQAEALLAIQDPIELLEKLDAELARLTQLRNGLAARYGPPKSKRAGRRRACRQDGCSEPALSRKHDGESGYGFCRKHWKALSKTDREHWQKDFEKRLETARAARGK